MASGGHVPEGEGRDISRTIRRIGARKTILRLLLIALGLAAAAGVMAVFLDNRWATLRIMWTGLLTAMVGAAMLPLARMLDRERTRPAGLFGLCVAVLVFLLTLCLIWLDPLLRNDHLAVTTGFVLGTGVVAFVGVVLLGSKTHRWAGRITIAAAVAALASFLPAIWLPGRLASHREWWETGWSCGLIGLIAAASAGGIDTGRRWWRFAGLAAAALAWILLISQTWDWTSFDNEHLLPPVSVALVFAVANLLFLIPIKTELRWLTWAVVGAVTLTTFAINAFVIDWFPPADDFFKRSAVAGSIVSCCGTMALVVMAILNRRVDLEASTSEFSDITLQCPRCRRKQSVPLGSSACGGCGLRLHVRVEEPRCAECGYLLWGTTSERCPECGTAVTAGAPPGRT